MRPRAKSYISSISQIEANRLKFSLSMTSEVRKCPNSTKSGRKSGFSHLAIERRSVHHSNVIDEICACARRTRRYKFLTDLISCIRPSFLKKTDFFLQFFTLSRFCHLIVVLGGAADPSVDHISAISTSRGFIFSRSSSVRLSGKLGIPGLFLARHRFKLFRGTKKWKFKMVRSGWNFQISRIASRELGKMKCVKKFFFFGLKKIC